MGWFPGYIGWFLMSCCGILNFRILVGDGDLVIWDIKFHTEKYEMLNEVFE